ncbi:peptidase C1B, bleomycin hydrolase [Metschnikowia bicuspidata var. bicuspidata NRRL YB-4993]|uniref:Cysteine proteinase 1, mitochondrial n=1 Tax=Metschnikowia bicuspidata var. bicuspidata NRRL YB-4993 TaxID=869754 RepID=A0A1A0HD74_9ASCO|nr:peptidase C1B, bleomycin hydrolase [Metschnikowia bicuspidata var. bicuspidata NRRL YB-4993]OBA21966.1 peptidase C1B, bleomycin hydrolase [Metschnikowia bicuspidata var. bicuspidata NRRL YB-4993]
MAPLETLVEGLTIGSSDSSSAITAGNLAAWETQLLQDPKNRLAQNALAKNAITDIVAASGSELSLKNRYFFNVEVDTIGSPSFLNNQKSSGRCWIFATCNVLRAHVIKKYGLQPDSFQLSQSYLFFYDKLEKANYFLENIIDTASEPVDSRLLQFLFSGSVSDGGQWDMIVNVIEKYGVVPNEVFPDNSQASSTSQLNYLLTNKLREYGLVLRKLVHQGTPRNEVLAVKNAMNKEVYNIIALALGTPPKPGDRFKWEFLDKSGKYLAYDTTPLEFYQSHTGYDVSKRFSLIHDPRNPYNSLYTVDRLNNVSGGKPIEYVNLELPAIKKAAVAMLKSNEPIFFGSDVGKFNNNTTGVLDTGAYDYKLAFNTSLKLSKLERLQTGSSAMTHAMVITGVHLDNVSGAPVRWKIENSWGDQVGDKGYFVMTDAWFDEYVFQIVTSKKYVEKSVYDLWKAKKYEQLPFYDPMGALA